MQTITVQKTKDCKEKVKTTVLLSDSRQTIKEPCILVENGQLIAIYTYLEKDTTELLRSVMNIEYVTGKRARGLLSTSRIFGTRPRLTSHHDYCSNTSLQYDFPSQNDVICSFGKDMEAIYKEHSPERYAKHVEEVKDVLPEWKIADTVFTSGIVNKNNQLKYYFDTGNFNNVFSAMIVLKAGVRGGNLCLPEYEIDFELGNNAVLLFDGQNILHGVTPIFRDYPTAYRYSLVYYSLKQVRKCLPFQEEIQRIRDTKMQREITRHSMPAEHRASLERRLLDDNL